MSTHLYKYFYYPEHRFKGIMLPLSMNKDYYRAVGYKHGRMGVISVNKDSIDTKERFNELKFFADEIEVPSEVIQACIRYIFSWSISQ